MKNIIDVTTLEDTATKVKCSCDYKMPILPPEYKWRKVRCVCGTIWWVKPSGRVFEKHMEHKDLDY